MQKPQMRAGPRETSNSDDNHVVLLTQGDRVGLEPMETSIVMHTQITRQSLGPIETCNSDPKVTALHAKTTDEGWDP